jgi:hypothetical protein
MKKVFVKTAGIVGAGVGVLALIVGLLILSPLFLMIAWNHAAPVFWTGAPNISFWTALWSIIALRIIFYKRTAEVTAEVKN